jgi:hypothetical protein
VLDLDLIIRRGRVLVEIIVVVVRAEIIRETGIKIIKEKFI